MTTMKTEYIHQTKGKGYFGCRLIALLNALIYYDKPHITSLDDPRWISMIDRYHARNGAAIGWRGVLVELGLNVSPIDRDQVPKRLPAMISSFPPELPLHSSLVVDTNGLNWTIINFQAFKGNLVQVVNKRDIGFLPKGVPCDMHYHVTLKDD